MAGAVAGSTGVRAGARLAPSWWRRTIAALVGVVVGCGGLVAAAHSASAATAGSVSGATLEWTFSEETNALAFNNDCNFWSAGQSDGSAATYKATDGHATVLKLNSSDQYVPISDYSTRCLDKNGQPVNFQSGAAARRLGQKVRFTGGTGSLDTATGKSTIQWMGTWSIDFYGSLLPFWMTDPKLTMDASGNGTLTATMGGYSSDMSDPNHRTLLTPASNVTIATIEGAASANPTGFTTTPKYAGVTYDVDPETGQSPQNRTNPGWGSWPKSFVDFQMQTGLGSYWYSSASSADARKPPQALTVSYGAFTAASTTVTPHTNLNPDFANTVNVTGSSFTGFAASESGVYVGFVPASKWHPGQIPNQADFVGTVFVPKAAIVDGSFSTNVTIPAGTVTNLSASYGIGTICAHGCSLTNRAYDTFSPVTFARSNPSTARVGSAFSYQVPAFAGTAPYHWSLKSGTLPPGLTLKATTGVISGTPTTEGKFTASVQVTDSKSPHPKSKTTRIVFQVGPESLAITPTSLPNAHVGSAYSATLGATGGFAPYKFKITAGALPPKVKLNGKGAFSGKPTAPGSYHFTVKVTDKFKYTATRSYELDVV